MRKAEQEAGDKCRAGLGQSMYSGSLSPTLGHLQDYPKGPGCTSSCEPGAAPGTCRLPCVVAGGLQWPERAFSTESQSPVWAEHSGRPTRGCRGTSGGSGLDPGGPLWSPHPYPFHGAPSYRWSHMPETVASPGPAFEVPDDGRFQRGTWSGVSHWSVLVSGTGDPPSRCSKCVPLHPYRPLQSEAKP